MLRLVLALALLAGGTGCGAAADEEAIERVSSSRQAVASGTTSPPSEDFVVQTALQVSVSGKTAWSPRCSGVLVAERLVVTTKKCVEKPELAVFLGAAARASIAAGARPTARAVGVLRDARVDIAVLVLDTPVTGKPLAALRLDGPAATREALTVVGYGTLSPTGPRSRLQGVAVTRATTTGFEVGGSACEDDRGGPALAGGDGVVGLASLVGICDGPGAATYTTIHAAKATIEQAFRQVGATPKRADAPLSAPQTSAGEAAVGDEDEDEEKVQVGEEPEPEPVASAGCAVVRAPSSGVAGGKILAGVLALLLGFRRPARRMRALERGRPRPDVHLLER